MTVEFGEMIQWVLCGTVLGIRECGTFYNPVKHVYVGPTPWGLDLGKVGKENRTWRKAE